MEYLAKKLTNYIYEKKIIRRCEIFSVNLDLL